MVVVAAVRLVGGGCAVNVVFDAMAAAATTPTSTHEAAEAARGGDGDGAGGNGVHGNGAGGGGAGCNSSADCGGGGGGEGARGVDEVRQQGVAGVCARTTQSTKVSKPANPSSYLI